MASMTSPSSMDELRATVEAQNRAYYEKRAREDEAFRAWMGALRDASHEAAQREDVRREMVELKNRRVAGKAMDDRACVAIVTLALEHLSRIEHAWDIFAVATTQEETGLKGATTSAYGVAPDLAVALDVSLGAHPGAPRVDTLPLGKGPSIGVGPNFHPKLVARLKKVARSREIPYQIEPTPGRSGTDAWAIQITREGVPTALVSVPVRYMHQPVETLDVQDVERAGRLLAAFIAGLETDFLEKLAWDSLAESE